MTPHDTQNRRYPTLREPEADALDALIWLSLQPQVKPIIRWLLACSADKDEILRRAESTPMFRAQGANQVLLDLLEYLSSPGEYKRTIDAREQAKASAGSKFMPNPLKTRGPGWSV